MAPVAVYLQERLQAEWTHDSRVAVTLSRLGFEVHAVTRESVTPWDSLPVWEEASRRSVIRRIARLSPDLLFCEGGAWHLYALPLAKHTWVRTPSHSSSPVKNFVLTQLLRRADAVSVCNPWERQHWKAFRLVNLPYPLDTAFWSQPTPRDPTFWMRRGLPTPSGPLVISIGQIIQRKRPVEIFDALAPMLHSRPDMTLVYVGETFEASVESTLRSRISAERLEPQVQLAGLIQPREDLRELLAWADVQVLNTTWESQCMALYESLAAGVPTLIPDIPELTWAFPNLLAHKDAGSLRRNLTAVLDDPSLGKRLVETSKPFLEWADNEVHDRTIEQVCAKLLNERPGRRRSGRTGTGQLPR